jgi:hypothetical protein
MANPDGLGYSQFCYRYKKWRRTTGGQVVMVQEREPGKLLKAHFFVATPGDSGFPVVQAFADEKMMSWLERPCVYV